MEFVDCKLGWRIFGMLTNAQHHGALKDLRWANVPVLFFHRDDRSDACCESYRATIAKTVTQKLGRWIFRSFSQNVNLSIIECCENTQLQPGTSTYTSDTDRGTLFSATVGVITFTPTNKLDIHLLFFKILEHVIQDVRSAHYFLRERRDHTV